MKTIVTLGIAGGFSIAARGENLQDEQDFSANGVDFSLL
jgi:hypothetical protein